MGLGDRYATGIVGGECGEGEKEKHRIVMSQIDFSHLSEYI